MTGLANGTKYYFTVEAVNGVGSSVRPTSCRRRPAAPVTVPGAPVLNTATAGNAQVALA